MLLLGVRIKEILCVHGFQCIVPIGRNSLEFSYTFSEIRSYKVYKITLSINFERSVGTVVPKM